jgi:hypothetical protein
MQHDAASMQRCGRPRCRSVDIVAHPFIGSTLADSIRMPSSFRSLSLAIASTLSIASLTAACSDDGASTEGTGAGGPSSPPPSGPGVTSGTASTSSANAGGGDEGGSVPNFAEPARYPLELVSPREAGTLPSPDAAGHAMPSGHRIFKAYPGIEYNVRAVVIAGSFPYTFSLSNAPPGMTIDASSGEVSWASPTEGTVTPSITVRDSEGTEITEPWTITVSTSGFRFVDAVNGNDSATGTLQSPWQTIAEVKASSAPGDIVYFRSGTYTTAGMAVEGDSGTWMHVEILGDDHSVQWIAYPGDAPAIDYGFTGPDTGWFFRFYGSDTYPVYLDGLEFANSWDKGMQFVSSTDYSIFRRLDIHDVNEAIDGSNSAGIMTLASYQDPSWYSAFQDNDFHDMAPGGIKQYSQKRLLWEDNVFRDSGNGPDLKAHLPRFEVRACSFFGNDGLTPGLFGNMSVGDDLIGETTTGEVRHNRILAGDSPDAAAMEVNQNSEAGRIELYRNTFIGGVRVLFADSEDGPFVFDSNVIVNSSTETDHITLYESTDPSVIEYADNLAGFPNDGIVDADGNLTGSYTQWLGLRGHQIP